MSDYNSNIFERVDFVASCIACLGVKIGEKVPCERSLVAITGFSRGKLREVLAVLDFEQITRCEHGGKRFLVKDIAVIRNKIKATGLIS